MGIKMRPLTNKDVENIASGVVNTAMMTRFQSSGRGTVCDDSVFGTLPEHRADRDFKYEDEFCRTAKLTLAVPVLNPFLAGYNGDTFTQILGKEKSVADIMYGRVVVDISGGHWTLVNSNSISGIAPKDKYLMGGEALLYLLNDMDVEQEIENTIYAEFIVPFLKKEERKDWKEKGIKHGWVGKFDDEFDPYESANWLFDDYFYMRVNKDKEPEEDEIERICADVRKSHMTHVYKKNSRLSFLLAYQRNPEYVKTMVMNNLLILPYGQRMTIDNRIDPLTKVYNDLVKANIDLQEALINNNYVFASIAKKYERVVNLITLIFLGKNDSGIYVSDRFKSIKDRLAGKDGLIRDKMQGGRTDYSGRTVITCDPYLSVDTIKIPKRMLGKLIEMDIIREERDHDKNGLDTNYYKLVTSTNNFKMNSKAANYVKDGTVFIGIGRQPTLFNLGIQSFKVIPTDGNAIVLSPLVVMPFNADFDGDQMHAKGAVTAKAKAELKKLMASTSNLRYARNGEITVVPRHEILYGLWICSKIKDGREKRTWNDAQLKELAEEMGLADKAANIVTVFSGVCCQKINVYDIINADTAYGRDSGAATLSGKTAGIWAIKYAIGKENSNYVLGHTPLVRYSEADGKEDKPCTTSWFKAIIANTPTNRGSQFVNIINSMVRLGFKVARVYPPGISIINDIDFSEDIKEFNKKIMEHERWIKLGFELQSSYSAFFSEEFDKLNSRIKKRIVEELGEDNGFIRMANSGAKGNTSNLIQIFGTKGRIMKNDNEAFDTIISNSLSSNLTSLEHFITAYGSREGLADKVLATAEPGYLTRKLEHAAACLQITCNDCGTTEGITIGYDDIIPFIEETKLSYKIDMDMTHVMEFLTPMLVGRVILPSNEYCYNLEQAEKLFFTYVVTRNSDGTYEKGPGVKFRSPITCECPVCCRCYGKDLTTGDSYPKVGKPIGLLAGQAIGEPGTQLTMKNFQRGGVASAANLTSAFDKIDAYFRVPKDTRKSRTLVYDHLSDAEGYVRPVYLGDGTKDIKVCPYSVDEDGNVTIYKGENLLRRRFNVPEGLILKDFVRVGDSFQKVQGDLDVREIIEYRGIDDAIRYLTLQLYKIFNDETEISLKHFEVIVASMVSYLVCRGDDQVHSGEVLSTIEFYNWEPSRNVYFEKILLGISELPAYRRDCFESIIMEDMGGYIKRSILLHPRDELKNPKTRLSFGMGIGMGSDVPGFMS